MARATWILFDTAATPRTDPEAYKALFASVLRRAIFDWILYRRHYKEEKRRLAADAYVWLFVERPGHRQWQKRLAARKEMLSFVSICDSIQVNPDEVHRVACGMTPKDIERLGRPATRRKVSST